MAALPTRRAFQRQKNATRVGSCRKLETRAPWQGQTAPRAWLGSGPQPSTRQSLSKRPGSSQNVSLECCSVVGKTLSLVAMRGGPSSGWWRRLVRASSACLGLLAGGLVAPSAEAKTLYFPHQDARFLYQFQRNGGAAYVPDGMDTSTPLPLVVF